MKSKNNFKLLAVLLVALLVSVFWLSGPNGSRVSAKMSGASVYTQHCASCHGGDGRAQTARGKRKGATDLTKSKISTAQGVKVIANGRGQMSGFKNDLSAAEISEVMDYIRGFRTN